VRGFGREPAQRRPDQRIEIGHRNCRTLYTETRPNAIFPVGGEQQQGSVVLRVAYRRLGLSVAAAQVLAIQAIPGALPSGRARAIAAASDGLLLG
jgi:hypothetical protein